MKVTQMLTADNLVSLGLEASMLQTPIPKKFSFHITGLLPSSGPFQTEGLHEVEPSWLPNGEKVGRTLNLETGSMSLSHFIAT